jgi:hypothetical protein
MPTFKENEYGRWKNYIFFIIIFSENNKISVKIDFCLNEIDWKYYRLKFIQAFGKNKF